MHWVWTRPRRPQLGRDAMARRGHNQCRLQKHRVDAGPQTEGRTPAETFRCPPKYGHADHPSPKGLGADYRSGIWIAVPRLGPLLADPYLGARRLSPRPRRKAGLASRLAPAPPALPRPGKASLDRRRRGRGQAFAPPPAVTPGLLSLVCLCGPPEPSNRSPGLPPTCEGAGPRRMVSGEEPGGGLTTPPGVPTVAARVPRIP